MRAVSEKEIDYLAACKKHSAPRSISCPYAHPNPDPSQAIQLIGQKTIQIYSQSSKKQQDKTGSNHFL
jgi:hypothetical protein